jgi:hypothetical protein
MRVRRKTRTDRSVITPNGFLKSDAVVTRSGIFVYRDKDGNEIRELRPPEEVFVEDSLNSLKHIPITDLGGDHPPEMVILENVKRYQVGITGERVDVQRPYVAVDAILFAKETVDRLDRMKTSGKKQELSLGYDCDVSRESGTWEGQPYDAIQRNIRYNHLSLVDQARAGPRAILKLDGSGVSRMDGATMVWTGNPYAPDEWERTGKADAKPSIQFVVGRPQGAEKSEVQSILFLKEEYSVPQAHAWLKENDFKAPGPDQGEEGAEYMRFRQRDPGDFQKNTLRAIEPGQSPDEGDEKPDSRGDKTMKVMRLKFHGINAKRFKADAVTIEVPEELVSPIEAIVKVAEGAGKALSDMEEEKVKEDEESEKEKLKVEEEKADAKAKEEKRIDAIVKERAGLLDIARQAKVDKADDMGAREIRVAVIQKMDKDFDPKDRDDAYVQGRYDSIVPAIKQAAKNDARLGDLNGERFDGDKPDPQGALANHMANAWKGDKKQA